MSQIQDPGEMPFVVNSRGRRIYFDPEDERGKRLHASGGNFNPLSLELWAHALRLRDWDAVVDIGCNYGEMVLDVDMPPAAQIIAYEPNRRILPYLKRSLGESSTAVELIEQGISDRSADSTDFAVDTEWSGTSTLAVSQAQAHAHGNVSVEQIRTVTLAESLGDRGFSSLCIKIDVEGYEFEVLAGAEPVLRDTESWAVMVEILHMAPGQVKELARRFPMFVLDARSRELVRLPAKRPELVTAILDAGWAYPQDALLLGDGVVAEISEGAADESGQVIAALNRAVASREGGLADAADAARQQAARAEEERRILSEEIDSFRSSTSWRVTGWLRAVSRLIQRR